MGSEMCIRDRCRGGRLRQILHVMDRGVLLAVGRGGLIRPIVRTYGSHPYHRGMMGRVVSFDSTCDGSRPARRGRSGREDSSDVTHGGSLPARRILSGRLDSSDPTRVGLLLSLRGMSRRVGGL